MTDIDLSEAKDRLFELIDRLQEGEEFQITRQGKVVAHLCVPALVDSPQHTLDAVTRLRVIRTDVSLGGLSTAELVSEGRR